MKKLTKKEIQALDTADLNTRYCYILSRGETLDAKNIPVTDAQEILWIEDELHRRLIKIIGHDFYPPDRIEGKKPTQPTETKPKISNKIKFKVIVTSSIGSKAAQFNVEANTKSEADIFVHKEISKLGLIGAKYKIN